MSAGGGTASLERYVPRIATDWDDDAPGANHQELDATLCFVDISGFTNLSEKLSRLGRIGAEELTSVLNYVFGRMLELAYLQGGSLLKFGGDALLLLYTGHDHASRAASAAVEMRTALRSAEEYKTSVGRLKLRMSVGIHSGEINLFRVGRSHRELVIAGPGGTATTVMEKTADPGEIVVSDGTKERLPEGATGDRKGAGWLLRWRKAHCIAPGPVHRDTRDAEDLSAWIPRALLDHLSAGETEAEHRIATVGFVRYCGVDHAMETRGAQWVADAIEETMSVIQEAADAEGITFLGTDINEDGGKAILVAGAPSALAEDEARMLRAARSIIDAKTPLDAHVGINRGHVFSGEVGTPFRATYTVMGDTVNLSARLMAAAPATRIYSMPSVLDQSSTLFATEPLEPFRVKGKEEPVRAYEVHEEIGARSTEEREALPFVARTRELAEITRMLVEVRAGRGDVATIVGEAGLGKSRLVHEASRAIPDLDVAVARSEPYGSATPYRPLRDRIREFMGIERATNDEMARSMLATLGDLAPDLLPMAPLLATVAHIDMDATPEVEEIEARFRQERLNAVVAELLDRLHPTPLVLVLEDAQWMDEASASLVNHLIGMVESRPWGVIAVRRPDEGGLAPTTGTRIEVTELDEADARDLVLGATQATPLHPSDVDTIVSRTGGNPLFIAEVLRIVSETGSTDQLPDSLGTLVTSSIDALPALTRRILRYASVLGRSFRASTLGAILSEDALELDAATREQLIDFIEPSGEGRFRFRTAMVRDVAYDGLSFRRREDLHRRAAHAIEQTTGGSPEEAADQLAMHYSLGNDHEHTWHYALVAAERAARAFANTEAATQYERALLAGRRLGNVTASELAATWTKLGDVREQAGLFDAALDAYRRASTLGDGDPAMEAELLLKRAWVRERAASYAMALREATRAKSVVASEDVTVQQRIDARATAFQALVRLRQGKVSDAYKRAASAAAMASEAGEKAALARASSVMAWTKVMEDDPGALDLCQQALELYEELGDLIGQNDMNNNLGFLAYFDGRWDDAVAYYERSRDGASRVGNVVDVGFAEANLGEVFVNQRRFEEAESQLRDAIRVLRATGEISTANFAELQLARVHIGKRDLGVAQELLENVISESREHGFTTNAAEAAYYLAECALEEGDATVALERLDQAVVDAGEEAGMFSLLDARLRGLALCRSGRVDEALLALDEAIASAADRGQGYDGALLRIAKADVLESTGRGDGRPLLAEADITLDALGVHV